MISTTTSTEVRAWMERLYADVPGSLVVAHETAGGRFVGTGGQCATPEDAAARIARLDEQGARSVYLRVTTVGRELARHERGGAEDAAYLPGLWADVDFGDLGHKHKPDPSPEGHGCGRTLPPDEDEARRIVATSGLPEPSLWVHSGGGLYPWWLLEEAAEVTEETRPVLAALASGWQHVLGAAAERLGYCYGTGVGDLARVLRVPGTTNRKSSQGRPCRVVEDHGTVYTVAELLDALTAAQPAPVTREPAPAVVSPVWSGPAGDESPLDRFARETTWAELLGRYGFTPCTSRHGPSIAECFTRPGDPDHPCSAHVLEANPHALVVWSENAGLPVGGGQKLTKARVAAHLEHGGDVSALARALTAERAPLPVAGGAGAPPADDLNRQTSDESTTADADAQTAAEAPGASWRAVDLSAVVAGLLAGTVTRPVPTVGRLTGAGALFYAGKVNGLAGASGSGKSWTALVVTAQELEDGCHVVYVDLEDDEVGVVGRLLDLGVKPDVILARFHYVHPDEALTATAAETFAAQLDAVAPSLVVIDSTGESMALDGAKPNDDDDTARWFRRLPTPVARRTGAAVVVVDHVVKADEGGLWPIGSQRKRAAVSGAQYMQSTVRTFAKDADGLAKLVCAKDRHGTYRAGQKVAELDVSTGDGSVRFDLRAATETAAGASGDWRPTALMERVSRALEAADEPLSFRGIDEQVKGKAEHKRAALRALAEAGHIVVTEGPRNAKLHTFVTRYTQRDDPGSDLYEGRDTLTAPSASESTVECVRVLRRDTGHTHSDRVPDTVGTQSGHGQDDPPSTCAYAGCDNPPRPDRQMCQRHFTFEPASAS